jgi:predicted nucleotidyltransferase
METSVQAALNVPSISNRIRVSVEAIQGVVDQIKEKYNPFKIILFGSYAYGNPCPESDVDMLVVMDMQKSEISQAAEICQNIQYRFGLDLIVVTPARLQQRIEWGDSFLREITSRGVILYESANA